MITVTNGLFELHTEKTSYVFRVMETGQLEHLHYGRKITLVPEKSAAADATASAVASADASAAALAEKYAFLSGNVSQYDAEHGGVSLDMYRLEMSSCGKGDMREPFVELTYADGSSTSDFIYMDYEVCEKKEPFTTLPGSYTEGRAEHLVVRLKERMHEVVLELHYDVYAECDVICRATRLINNSKEKLVVKRCMSTQLDLDDSYYTMTTFGGAWAREMERHDTELSGGKLVNASCTGTSSNRANPFVILRRPETQEHSGECYGMNLIYSGNHYEAAEVSCYKKLRFVSGINPQGFGFVLEPGESFEAPEAVMSYTTDGLNALSQNMHAFVREHIVRGTWKRKVRPVLLNSWEAAYFDISESKLLKLAKAGKEVGIELFVMDDGWFGKRDDDSSSLGDWYENPKKLPGGLKSLADKVNKLGLQFGIWVEPEMVNVKSKLYEKHPEWAMDIPGQPHAEGRNQRLLDMGNPKVQDYVIAEMKRVFASANIAYVKWDMNRNVTDVYSKVLPAERQGEVLHRYVMGLYRCMKELTESFPDILFEGCAAGGNRFDLGILSYFPQIWASDDTDAACRAEIQQNYSYGYPMSAVTAHVSACPNHQTLRTTPLASRFNIAAFGLCGYECNLCDMSAEELEKIREQIALYKEWREVLQFGAFYRQQTRDVNKYSWTCVAPDKSRAVGMIFQKLVTPNMPTERYVAAGLAPEKKYHFYYPGEKHNLKCFGDLVNTVSPVHIKQDSLMHNVLARFVKMDGETEDYELYGDALMHCGVMLKQGFAGTGYNEKVRYYQDFASRMYFMEEV